MIGKDDSMKETSLNKNEKKSLKIHKFIKNEVLTNAITKNFEKNSETILNKSKCNMQQKAILVHAKFK